MRHVRTYLQPFTYVDCARSAPRLSASRGMYAFTLPPPPRVVDDINVKRPAFYGDTGGPGWYAESQYPVRRRLAVEYKPRWGRDVYIRPTELILPALKLPIDLESIRAKFERFNLVSARNDSRLAIILV